MRRARTYGTDDVTITVNDDGVLHIAFEGGKAEVNVVLDPQQMIALAQRLASVAAALSIRPIGS